MTIEPVKRFFKANGRWWCLAEGFLASGKTVELAQDHWRARRAHEEKPGRAVGERHPKSVLSDHEVGLLRQLRAEGRTYLWLAEKFEIPLITVRSICRGRTRLLGTEPEEEQKPALTTPHLTNFPAGAMVRVREICGDRKTNRPGLLPIVPRTWLKWVADGKVPAGKKIGSRTRAWRVEDVIAIRDSGLKDAA